MDEMINERITDPNLAFDALLVAEERMRFALENAGVGIWDMDCRTGAFHCSEILETQCGLQPGRFGGTFEALVECIHPDERSSVRETARKAMATGTDFSQENRVIWPDGTVRWLDGAGRFFLGEDGQPVRGVGISRDVTERHTQEEHLDRTARLLAAIVESSDDAIISKTLEGVIMSWNRSAERLFGYSASEAIGQSIMLLVPPDLRAEEDRVIASIRNGEPVEMETERQRKDGTRVAISLKVSPITDAGRHVVGASKIARDITERKKAEATLCRLSGRLLNVEDEERRRLSRELHDSTAQRLAALCMNLAVVAETAAAFDQRTQRALSESAALADECLQEVRTVAYLLHPPDLDDLGLQFALARYIDGFVQRSGISVAIDVPPDLGRLPRTVETTIFRIVQECLSNIHHHSGSRTAHIRLRRGPSDVVVDVEDGGTGLQGNGAPGVGIASMRERLQQFSGSLQISSQPGKTNVKAVIPLSHLAA
jgi:two-component system NarL family sensor kinase